MADREALTRGSAPEEVFVEGTYVLFGDDLEQLDAYVREAGMTPDDALWQVVQDALGKTGFKVSTVGP